MPSTYSDRLRLELQASGENRTTWGTKANNVFRRVDEAVAGFLSLTMVDADHTLTAINGSSDEARYPVIELRGTWTASRTLTIPAAEKWYIIRNYTAGGYTATISNGTNSVTLGYLETAIIFTDGVEIRRWGSFDSLSANGGTLSGALDMSSNKITSLANGTATTDAVNLSQLNQAVPVGTIFDYVGSTAPANYMFPYGQAISRTTYADLYAVIGDTFGAGDGSTTFNLPDFRGRVSAGKDDMGGSAANRLTSSGGVVGTTLGATGGAQTHTLTDAEVPAHSHTYSGTSSSNGGHSHTFSATTSSAGSHNHTFSGTTSSGGNHRHSISTYNNGHDNPQGRVGAGEWNSAGTHYTNYDGTHSHTFSGTTSSVGHHTHSVSGTTSSVSSHTHTYSGTTSSHGGGGAHKNVQPTIVVNKIIKVL